MPAIAGSLEALLAHVIDYAGLFPPAGLPLDEVCERYAEYLNSPERWLLNRLVLPAACLENAQLPAGARVSLLVEAEPGPLPAAVESLETRQAHGFSLPTYCEAPAEQVAHGFAKVRTGGLTPDAIISAPDLADSLCHLAALRRPFKATAGLHHAIRAERPLTYANDSPRAVLHGFLNVFAAAAFAWHGLERGAVLEMLEERDAGAFAFTPSELVWRGKRLSPQQIRAARRDFAHSFGSCSFEEPVTELRALELIP